ncbi:translation elongation factor Ts [Candidatus Nitrosacidococcus tergens]|uniref:Elongation factor Ts n=1 Tax=Candidatus Nitrosacidococcus tergens TaxID=553981 RepID=A0A7G1Q8S8_9GAMM|nr:translation elongation factor Ts [Candidatus Nitrosacidococcus tergens]CAB1274900.1 protein chain elongation factor EF-Ts [Candidatus Nitrosacidococcus tergens]
MAVTATQVKELRERTGAGMMECKKALIEAHGDIDAAIEWMRKQGLAKADKKSGRIAAEGIITIEVSSDNHKAVIIEVNSETDFVAKNDDFCQFAAKTARRVLASNPKTLDELLSMPLEENNQSIDEVRQNLIAKIGENINIRRFSAVESKNGSVGYYAHGNRIGVIVAMEGGNSNLAKDIAMHIAASKPQAISKEDISTEILDKEREIILAQSEGSNKSPEIIEKMVEGRLQKFLNEVTLLGQSFIKDPDIKVGKLLKNAQANVLQFIRLEVGEGVEKKVCDFAEEVRAQAQGG